MTVDDLRESRKKRVAAALAEANARVGLFRHPKPPQKTTAEFTCENCDRRLPASETEPVKIGAFLDDDDFGLWCAECVKREL